MDASGSPVLKTALDRRPRVGEKFESPHAFCVVSSMTRSRTQPILASTINGVDVYDVGVATGQVTAFLGVLEEKAGSGDAEERTERIVEVIERTETSIPDGDAATIPRPSEPVGFCVDVPEHFGARFTYMLVGDADVPVEVVQTGRVTAGLVFEFEGPILVPKSGGHVIIPEFIVDVGSSPASEA